MPRKSNKTIGKTIKQPNFKTESEEAAWYASPDGRRYAEELFDDGKKRGTLKVMPGGEVQRTDPAVLAELVARVQSKQTKAVSLRIPVSEIARAKKIAAEAGIGYQTLLKEMISQGLRRAT